MFLIKERKKDYVNRDKIHFKSFLWFERIQFQVKDKMILHGTYNQNNNLLSTKKK